MDITAQLSPDDDVAARDHLGARVHIAEDDNMTLAVNRPARTQRAPEQYALGPVSPGYRGGPGAGCCGGAETR